MTSFAAHPEVSVPIDRLGKRSTAAGAYQFLSGTWDEVSERYGIRNISPKAQDFAAVVKLKDRGALDDVLSGRLTQTLLKTSHEWASLPPFRHKGQGRLSFSEAQAAFVRSGGKLSG